MGLLRTEQNQSNKLSLSQQHRAIVGRHSEAEWAQLLQSWGWRCFYCGSSIRLRWEASPLPPENEATKDHLVPICRGGVDYIENIVPACKRCNCMKGMKTADEFLSSRPGISTSLAEKQNIPTGNPFYKTNGLSPEEINEPGLLKHLVSERERVSWCWRHPA